MKKIIPPICISLFLAGNALAQNVSEKKAVIDVAQQFFDTLENGDSLTFFSLFLQDAFIYYVSEEKDSVRTSSRSAFKTRFSPDRIIKERMKDTGISVQVHERIAMAWIPYDLWINDVYSHCGVDVFTLLNTISGWKIASLAFSMEKQNCK